MTTHQAYKNKGLDDITGEEWMDIPSFEERYQASSLGRVKSLSKLVYNGSSFYQRPAIILSPRVSNSGYLYVDLRKDGKYIREYIHVLVAKTFIPNPRNKRTVNHIKGDKLLNGVGDLEWATFTENHRHARRNRLMPCLGQSHHWAKLKDNEVVEIYESTEIYKYLAAVYNVTVGTIGNIKRGFTWGHITGAGDGRYVSK